MRVLKGRAAILPLANALAELADRWGQAAEMGSLTFHLQAPTNQRKLPYLVVLANRDPATSGERIYAAVLLFEYQFLGRGTGAFAAYDRQGFSAVIAPRAQRSAVALAAADALLHAGAHTLLLPCAGFSARPLEVRQAFPEFSGRWTQVHHTESRSLRLGVTLESTLARFGRKTRFNMGYYRRRLLRRMHCELHPNVLGIVSEAELQQINAGSLNPLPPDECSLRYRTVCILPGGFLMGLRAGDGRWLALIGGWRQNTTTVLHWQNNTAGFEKDSIGTVMRSYFLEHEIACGMRLLMFDGGTQHSMGHAFERERITDFVVQRSSFRSLAIRLLASAVASQHGLRSRTNRLAELLQSRDLSWHRLSPGRLRSPVLASIVHTRQVAPPEAADAEFRTPAA